MFLVTKTEQGNIKKKFFLTLESVKNYVAKNPGWEVYRCLSIHQGWIEKKGKFNTARKSKFLKYKIILILLR